MGTMLPVGYGSSLSLADVLPSCLAAVAGESSALKFPAVERVVVILVDGLGAHALRARAGHARFLSLRLTRASTIASGFPTTTAAALSTLCTGTLPGQHGMVGYKVRNPDSDEIFNQLSGWHNESPDPKTWQREQTVFERAQERGIRTYAVGPVRYQGSAFTSAVLRGAEYVPTRHFEKRFEAARRILDRGGKSITYLYIPELDMAAHAKGWESSSWLAALENLDAHVAQFNLGLRTNEAALVTADHGIVDVPSSAHVLFDTDPELVAGVRHVGGDPRCLQLYLEPGVDPTQLASCWRAKEGHRSWIATRDEAIAAGWFGPHVAEEVRPRIGDVLVAARARIAYYDSRDENTSSQSMVGQHGSFDPAEVAVPLIRLGAFE